MVTKQELFEKLYGKGRNDLFEIDYALPEQGLQFITQKVANDPHDRDECAEIRRKLLMSVYAYDRRMNLSGFIPLTSEARMIFSEYNRKTGADLLYMPTIREKDIPEAFGMEQ